jgi:hypothetical protein
MPNCDFYGTPGDHEPILDWLLREGTCEIYEMYSDFEKPLKQFSSSAEVLRQFETHKVVHLQLLVLGASPVFKPRRITLNPSKCDGATFRYTSDGWGLVQLYLTSPVAKGLDNSHTNHNTQKRAEKWANTVKDIGKVNDWNFKKITSFSSKLNRQINTLGVGKIKSRSVLPGALRLWNKGVPLFPYQPSALKVELK